MRLFEEAGQGGRKRKDEILLERLLSRDREQAKTAQALLFSKYHKLVAKGDKRLSLADREWAYETVLLNLAKSLSYENKELHMKEGLGAIVKQFFEIAQKEMLWTRAIQGGEGPAYTKSTKELMLHLAPFKDNLRLKRKWGEEIVGEAFVESFEELLKKMKEEGFKPRKSLTAFFRRILDFRLLDFYKKEKKHRLRTSGEPGDDARQAFGEDKGVSAFNRFEEPSESGEILIGKRLRAFLEKDNYHLLEELSQEARMAVKDYWSDILSDLSALIKALKKMKEDGQSCVELLIMKVEKRNFREIYRFLEKEGFLKTAVPSETGRKNLVNSRIKRCRERLYEQLEPVFKLAYRKKDNR